MIDYLIASKHLSDKDNPFFGLCTLETRYSSGWEKYIHVGCNKIEIWWNPSLRWIKVEGSIIYYWQGHNFSYSRSTFVEAINHIERLLQVYLWDSVIKCFEFGVIIEVEQKPKEYILRHNAAPKEKLLKNERGKDKGNFRWWEDKNVSNKMYDAKQNVFNKQSKAMQGVIVEAGMNPKENYLKWESHYLKPEILNQGRELHLYDLVNSDWENVFKEDLYKQYKRLIPMKSIVIPSNKKDLSTPDILVMEEIQLASSMGETMKDIKKRKYDFINKLPLEKADKDARKRQINAIFNKIRESSESKWDLSEKIQEALSEAPQEHP